MHVVVAGATGFIGRPLCIALARQGHRVTALARHPDRAAVVLPPGIEPMAWDPARPGDWRQAVATADAVVNLAGEPLASARWTPAVKERLRASRIETTRAIVEAGKSAGRRDLVLLNASATGYYGDRGSEPVTEEAEPGSDFLARLCAEWEAEATKGRDQGWRVVLLRTGIVLGEGGGALPRLIGPIRLGVGGRLGSGKQYVPWVHLEDHLELIGLALNRDDLQGPLNCVAPNPATNAELTAILASILRRPAVAPVPGFVLRLVLGEFAEALLGGQRVVPAVAQRSGYLWRHPDLEPALRAILGA
jgi:hypothetical protein